MWKLEKKATAIVSILGREGSDANNMCVWATERKTRQRESPFYDEMASELDLGSSSKTIFSLGVSISLWGNVLRVLKICMREWP